VIESARFVDLRAHQLYGILRLRAEVFVVEQECVYLDPDGRDEEPTAWHLWVEEHGVVVVTGRLLDDGEAWRIGRVATAPEARGRGLAAELIRAAVARCDDGRPVVLDAQSHLVEWYGTLGFEPAGQEFVEDGIPHTPMRLVV
jgi:ElaA protein